MEAANIYAGDHDPSASNHVSLRNVKLPNIENNYVDHAAGGAPFAIEVSTHVNKMESTFSLVGWSPHVLTLLGSWEAEMRRFTVRGAVRDRKTGGLMPAVAILSGELGKADPTEFRRGELMAHDYSIRGIVSYRLEMAGVLLLDWDFFENKRVIGDNDLNAELNGILGLTGTGGGDFTTLGA